MVQPRKKKERGMGWCSGRRLTGWIRRAIWQRKKEIIKRERGKGNGGGRDGLSKVVAMGTEWRSEAGRGRRKRERNREGKGGWQHTKVKDRKK